MMNDEARSQLIRMIQSIGPQVCNTPSMCTVLLKQHCGSHPEEVGVLAQALKSGVVAKIYGYARTPAWAEFAPPLVEELSRAGVSSADAAWAVDSWALALGKHPESQTAVTAAAPPRRDAVTSAPADLPVPSEPPNLNRPSGPPVTSLPPTMLVTLAGALGAAVGVFFAIGIVILFDIEMGMPAGIPADEEFIPAEEQQVIGVARLVLLGVFMLMGTAGGALGSFAGWKLGGGHPDAAGTAAVRVVGAAFLSSALCAYTGGCFCVGMFLVPLIATATASLSVAFTGE